MATLTPLQITMCRADIGDITNNPYDVSDNMLQAIYDDPTLANSNLNLLRMYALRQRRGIAINSSIDDTGNITGINSRNSQKLSNIERLLAYWESVCGVSQGQSIGASTAAMQRGDQVILNDVFAWQADAFVARLVTNEPDALSVVETEDSFSDAAGDD